MKYLLVFLNRTYETVVALATTPLGVETTTFKSVPISKLLAISVVIVAVSSLFRISGSNTSPVQEDMHHSSAAEGHVASYV